MRSREALKVETVADFLHGRFEAVHEAVAIGRGERSQAFAFRARDCDYVVRFGTYREDFEKNRAATRYAGPHLPIPQVDEIGEAFGGAYAVSIRAHVTPLEQLNESAYRRALPSVFRMLDALRSADVSGTTGYGMWRPDGSAPYASWQEMLLDVQQDRPTSRCHGGGRRCAACRWRRETFSAGYRELEALAVWCPEDRYLIHADIVGDNMRVQQNQVTAIFDWGEAMYCDFLYDLAVLDIWAPWYPAIESVDVLAEEEEYFRFVGVLVPEFAERGRCYEVHIGLESQAYSAFMQRWGEVERSGMRTLEVALRDSNPGPTDKNPLLCRPG